jgi:hypothetical protein
MTTTPRLGAPQVADASTTPGTDCNEQCAYFDMAAGHFSIADRDATSPPGSPSTTSAYLVAASPSGAWTGHAGDIAFLLNGTWTFIDVREGMSFWIEDEDLYLVATSGSTFRSFTAGNPTEQMVVACSDEATALVAGAAKVAFRMGYAFTVTGVRASLSTAQTSGSIFTVDINEAGTSILSTKLTIDNTEKTSTSAATPAVISDSSIADDAEITVDIDQVGDGTAKGLKITLIGSRT